MSDPSASAKRIAAIGLLTSGDLAVLGQGFRRAFPVPTDGDFGAILREIDAAVEASNERPK